MRDRFGIFGTVTRFRELSLLLVMMLRIPNSGGAARTEKGGGRGGGGGRGRDGRGGDGGRASYPAILQLVIGVHPTS